MIWLRSEAGNAWLAAKLEQVVTSTMEEGELQVGGVQTNLFDRVVIRDIALVDGQGRPVIQAPTARAEISWAGLLQGSVTVERLVLDQPQVDLQVDEEGLLDLSRMFPSTDEPSPPSELPIRIELSEVRLDEGGIRYDPGGQAQAWELQELSLQGAARGEGTVWTLPDLAAAGVFTEPELGAFTLSGGLRYDLNGDLDLSRVRLELADSRVDLGGSIHDLSGTPSLELAVRADADLDALEPLTGDLGLNGALGAKADLNGPLDALGVVGEITRGEGSATVDLTVDTTDPEIGYQGSIQAEAFDLGLVDAVTEETVLTGSAQVQGRGVSYPDGIDASGSVALTDSVGWGYPLPGVSASFTFQDGQIRTKDLLYEAWWGRIEGRGRLGETDLDMDLLATVWDARGLEDFGAPGLRGSAVLDGRLQADWSVSDNTTTDLVGTLSGQRLGYESYVTIGEYDGPVSVFVDAGGVQVSASEATLREIDASGVTVAILQGSWEAFVDPAGAVEYAAELDGAVLQTWEIHADSFGGHVSGRTEPDGATTVSANLGMQRPGIERFVSDGASAVVVLQGDEVMVDLRCRSHGVEDCALVGGGDLASGRFSFSVFELGPRDALSWVNEGPLLFTLTPSYMGATDMDIHLRSIAGEVDVEGDLDLEGPLDATVSIRRLMLPWMGALFPEELGGWSGMADAELTLGGQASDARVQGQASVSSLSIPGQVWGLNGRVAVDGGDDLLKLNARVSDQKEEVLALRASLPIALDLAAPEPLLESPLDVEVLLQDTAFGAIQTLLPGVGELRGGSVAGLGHIGGTWLAPTLDLSLGTEIAPGDPVEWVRMDLDVTMDEQGQIRVRGGGHNRGERLLDMGGGASLDLPAFTAWIFQDAPEPDMGHPDQWLSNLSLSLVPLRVPMRALRGFAEIPEELDGRVTGAIAIYGELAEPQVSGALQLTEARVGDLPLEPAVISLSPSGEGYGISGLFGFRQDESTLHTFNVGGFVPFTLGTAEEWSVDRQLAREGLALELSGDGIPVAALRLVDPGITDPYGLLNISGTITGSLASPVPDLDVLLPDGGFSYPDINTRFNAMHIRAKVTQDAVALREMRFFSRPLKEGLIADIKIGEKATKSRRPACVAKQGLKEGQTRLEGQIALDGFALGAFDLGMCSYQAIYSATEEYLVDVTTQLQLSDSWPEVKVTGKVLAEDLRLNLDESVFFDDLGLSLDPRIELVRRETQVVQIQKPAPEFWTLWDVDVEVDFNRATRLDIVVPLFDGYDEALKLSEVRLQNAVLDGVVDFGMQRDFYEATGLVEVIRGSMELINKSFRIDEGSIDFGGDDIENPTIDFTASRDEGNYGSISVGVTGTVENPELSFGSDSGYSNTDVLTILLLGMPTSELGTENGSTAQALLGAQLSGVLTEQVESSFQMDLFDTLQVNSGDALLDSIVVGKSLGPNTYGELKWNLAPDEDESGAEITVEFLITRKLALELSHDTDNSADLLYSVKF